MLSSVTIIALAAGSFLASNVDNALILSGWLLAGHLSTRKVAAGYALAALITLCLSATLGYVLNVLPIQYIGFLAIVPILLGVKLIAEQVRQGPDTVGASRSVFSTLSVAIILLASSVDTVLVFAALFADSNPASDVLVAAGFLLAAAGWFVFVHKLTQSAARLRRISSAAQWLAPAMMIIVGSYIFLNTATDVVPGT